MRTAYFCVEPLEQRQLLSTTYYVSPTGNNSNAGTDPSAPWATVAKVNGRTFQAGDQILFQRGGTWRESLQVPSSGASGSPIVFGAYGNAGLAKPLFIGSDVLNPGDFSLVTGTTYSLQSATAINWIYDNHDFTRNAAILASATDSTTRVNYVKANAHTFFYDSVAATLYLNLGSALSGHTITGATREDAVFNNGKSFVTFQNLASTETASLNGGYGFRAEQGTNVSIINCDASLAGKHHFGDIDSSGFLGQGLKADQSPPDFGFGGATAFVTFSDAIAGRHDDTSQWIDCTYTNTNGPYPAFITHGDPGAIGNVLVQNLTSLNGYGSGIQIFSTGSSERVIISGGHLDGGIIELDTDSSLIDGVHITGAVATISSININGNADVVQNCVVEGFLADPAAGLKGGIVDGGHNNTIRFNTVRTSNINSPAITVINSDSNTHIYGNIIDAPQAIRLLFNNNNGTLDSDYNLFGTTYAAEPKVGLGDANTPLFYAFSVWTNLGREAHSPVADAKFTNAAAGDYSLQATSPAIDLYTGTPDNTTAGISTDFLGHARPQQSHYDAGAIEFVPAPPVIAQITASVGAVTEPAAGATTTATFIVTLDQSPPASVTVHYATADGTALAGTDYDAASGTLTFPSGTTSKTISVTVHGVANTSSNKMFVLNLSNPSANATISTSQVQATITFVPPANSQVSATSAPVTEPAAGATTTATFTVTLNHSQPATATVDYATADGTALAGTDYDTANGTLTFAPGQTSKQISVTVHGVAGTASNKTFVLSLSNASANATISTPQVTATITFVPAGNSQVSVTTVPVAEPATGATTTATFTVTLDHSQAAAATVDYATADGSAIAGTDYDAVSGTLTFAAGETSKQISVTVHGVSGTTSDKTFVLSLSNASANATISTPQVTATITATGSSTPPVTFNARAPLSYTDSAGHAVIIRLIGPGDGAATFDTGVAEPSLISLSNTTAASLLIVRSIGGATTLHDLNVQGSLGIMAAASASLAGDLTITGGARVVLLGDASGQHTITLGAAAVPTTLRLGNVSDLSVMAAGPIGTLIARNWIDTNATADTITAPSLNVLNVIGTFGAGLAIGGNVTIARVAGPIAGGAWNVAGSARSLVAGSVAAGWTGTFSGDIGVAAVLGNFAGSLTANSIRAMIVRGELSGHLRATSASTTLPAIGTLSVVGSISNADIRSAGNISVVNTGGLINSTVFAGVNDAVTTLPSDTSAFTTQASILLVNVRGVVGASAFSNSLVSASSIRTAIVHAVHGDAAATPFGIATNQLTVFADIRPGARPVIWRSATAAGTPVWSTNFALQVFPVTPDGSVVVGDV